MDDKIIVDSFKEYADQLGKTLDGDILKELIKELDGEIQEIPRIKDQESKS